MSLRQLPHGVPTEGENWAFAPAEKSPKRKRAKSIRNIEAGAETTQRYFARFNGKHYKTPRKTGRTW